MTAGLRRRSSPAAPRPTRDYLVLANEVAELDAAIAEGEKNATRWSEARHAGVRVWRRDDVVSAEDALVRYRRDGQLPGDETRLILRVLLELGPGSLAGIVKARRLATEIPGPLKAEKARKVARCVVTPVRTGRPQFKAINDARLYLSQRVGAATTEQAVARFARSEHTAKKSALLRLRRARASLQRALDDGVLMYDLGDDMVPSLEHLLAETLVEALVEV